MGQENRNLRAEKIRPFFEPKSVALIGVPRRTGHASFNILETLVNCGYPGQLYPVNPNADSILGRKSYPRIEDLPYGIELAIIMTPRDMVLNAIESCAKQGIKAATIVSDGFAEAGNEGYELQTQLTHLARAGGIRVVGPNSLGSINNFQPFSSSFLPPPPIKAPIALVSQSGGFFEGFFDFIASKGIDLGNMCDVDFADILEYLEIDQDTKLIFLHIEGLRQGRRFLNVARRVSQKKPILALKTGRTPPAARVIASHSGSLAGQDELYNAAFRYAGVIRVENSDELGDVAKALLYLPPLKRNQVGIITPTGGCSIMAVDALGREGFELAKLSSKTVNALTDYFPEWAPPRNPLDMLAAGMSHGYRKVYRACLEALLDDPQVDAIICIAGWPTIKTIQEIAVGKTKPVVVWMQGRWTGESLSWIEKLGYKTAYPTPERAARALSKLRLYHNRNDEH